MPLHSGSGVTQTDKVCRIYAGCADFSTHGICYLQKRWARLCYLYCVRVCSKCTGNKYIVNAERSKVRMEIES